MRKYSIVGIMVVIAAAVIGMRALSPPTGELQDKPGAPGEIRGRVLDSRGRPVFQARIHIRRPGSDVNGRIIYYYTDGNGEFSIKGLAAAEYKVFVVKEEDRHPDTDIFFYKNAAAPVPLVKVSDTQPTPFVTVQTGPPAALLTGQVIDAVSGKLIPSAWVTFNRPESEAMYLKTSLNKSERPGTFGFLLPSAPLTIQVAAEGYQTWTYRTEGSKKQMDLLTLEPGQTMQLIVKMKPLRK